MEKKKSISFTLSIVAIIVGVALYKQFDFKTLKFEKPALALVYGITFAVSVYVLIRGSQKKSTD
jgi:multisubunit Na+/H+ antiporter MnhG subunit